MGKIYLKESDIYNAIQYAINEAIKVKHGNWYDDDEDDSNDVQDNWADAEYNYEKKKKKKRWDDEEMDESLLRETIKSMVEESFDSFMGDGFNNFSNGIDNEVKGLANSRAHSYKKKESDVHRHNKMKKKNNGEEDKDNKTANKGKRSLVITWLNDPAVNCAEIMRKLWQPEESEEDAARSYFYKCRDGKLNDSGIPYKFSDSDINKLYKIKSETSA